jgi:hypothetical protein
VGAGEDEREPEEVDVEDLNDEEEGSALTLTRSKRLVMETLFFW